VTKPGLKEWGTLAEIVGTIAVVVSLLLVLHSLNLNNALISAQVSDNTYDALREAELFRLGNRELLAITSKPSVDLGSLSATEQELYVSWVYLYLDEWERLVSRADDQLIAPGNLDDWQFYFENWSDRYVTQAVWDRIGWRYRGGIIGRWLDDKFGVSGGPR